MSDLWFLSFGVGAMLLLGGYLCVIGVGLSAVYGGFTGKIPAAPKAAFLLGVAIIAAAFYFAPFTISWGYLK